ncbi:hypothetical protein G3M48_007489 [Beauveria asiatica]|uniref:Alcohol dehydrogenase-like N-terminal domain-containing protein n=1 Tax=Beauveria asiatica TaxID=1069075 RepID=A0AAW0RM25_9HYPO
MVLPATQKAIVIQGPGVAKVVTDRPIPELRHDYILVKTAAVGLNPTDWKSVEFRVKEAGPVVGCDYAGIVEAVGPAVKKPLKKGDRVCGVDTVSLPESTKICEGALSSSPPPGTALRYHFLLPATTSRSDVKDTFSLAYTAIGEGFTGGHLSVPASEEDFLFGVEFWDLSRELLESGKIKASPGPGRCAGWFAGLERKQGDGEDLVKPKTTIASTPTSAVIGHYKAL